MTVQKPIPCDKQMLRVRQAFSRAAGRYDSLTGLHQKIGDKLLEAVRPAGPYTAILDIGMGTGRLTQQICAGFPAALVTGMDFAEGMVACARKKKVAAHLVLADAGRLPFKSGVFDLIISNLAFQWLRDLRGAFGLCHRSLRPGGDFVFSLFGQATFCELFDALDQAGILPARSGQRLASALQVRQSLETAGFKDIRVAREIFELRFSGLLELLRWMKNIGANRLNSDIVLGKDALKRIASFYRAQDPQGHGVAATYEIVRASCRKRE